MLWQIKWRKKLKNIWCRTSIYKLLTRNEKSNSSAAWREKLIPNQLPESCLFIEGKSRKHVKFTYTYLLVKNWWWFSQQIWETLWWLPNKTHWQHNLCNRKIVEIKIRTSDKWCVCDMMSRARSWYSSIDMILLFINWHDFDIHQLTWFWYSSIDMILL